MKQLIIRADANSRIGVGHVMRCLALAQAWQDKGEKAVFLSHCKSPVLKKRILDEGFDFISLDKPYPEPFDIDYTLNTLHKLSNQDAWLVVDGYHFDSSYQKSIKEAGHKLLWIDDYGHAAHYYADIVLNQNISADERFYIRREPYTRLLLGTRYVLLRHEFKKWQGWRREIPSIARKVLVTLGGSDPDNVTLKVIKALKQVKIEGVVAKIVVGPANPNLQTLAREISGHANLQIITNATNMPEMMAWADVAVSAGGSTCWEVAFMGLPNMIVVLAENQVNVAERLQQHGLSVNFGWYHNVSAIDIARTLNDLMKSDIDLKKMCRAAKRRVDGKGCERIINAMRCEDLMLRKASIEDCELLFAWVNDPDVRRSAFCSDPIAFNEHAQWYREKLDSANFIQFIAVDQDGRDVGQVRFDLKNSESEVDVSVAREFRGLGYGTCIIRKGVYAVIKIATSSIFNANIKSYNQASIRSFEQAGFSLQGRRVINGQESVHLIFHHGQD